MAPRLNVIISQPATRDSHSTELEEKLIGELIMSQGLDANLVGPLEHIAPDSTDWLCLNGFRGSLALISWMETEQIAEHWSRLGLTGTVRKFGTPGSPGQSIIHIPVAVDSTVEKLTADLLKILDDRSVKTVGISMPMPVAKTPAEPAPKHQNGAKTDAALRSAESHAQDAALQNHTPQQASPSRRSAAPEQTKFDSEDDWASLDHLIDELDAFDQ